MAIEPYRYLEQLAQHMDTLHTAEQIHKALDELDFVYEALPPEHQDLATPLIQQLTARLQQCRPS